eukprot:4120354-Amphidinium_carterae.1
MLMNKLTDQDVQVVQATSKDVVTGNGGWIATVRDGDRRSRGDLCVGLLREMIDAAIGEWGG